MLVALKLFVSIAIPVGLGVVIVLSIAGQRSWRPLPLTALAYGLGMGVLTQWMLILGAFKIPFGVAAIGLPLLVTAVLLSGRLYLQKTRCQNNPPIFLTTAEPSNVLNFLLKLFIIYFLGYITWRAVSVPIGDWDAIATIAYKAKVFFYERSIAHLKTLPYDSYPLHVSFSEAWVAFNLGYWDDALIKIVFPLYALSYLCLHYEVLKLFTNTRWALLGCVLLLSSNFFVYHSTIGYRDIVLMYYNCTTVLLLVLWVRTRYDAFVYLAGLFSGFTTFAKMEGVAYFAVHTVLVIGILAVLMRDSWPAKFKQFLKFIVPSAGIYSIYFFYKVITQAHLVKPGTEVHFSFENFKRIPKIIEKFAEGFFWLGDWNIVWVLLFISLLNYRRIKESAAIKIFLAGLLLMLGAFSSFLLLTEYFDWISKPGMDYALLSRLLLHVFPLVAALVVLLGSPSLKESR